MENGLLNSDELLIDVAMRGIGIQLPDEFVLRLVMLKKKADERDFVTSSSMTLQR